jgi:predicted metal-dependent phosphoesterase TrpH
MDKIEILKLLSVPDVNERLDNLEMLLKSEPAPVPLPQFANNHIHTTYSFSPYTPSAAIYFAREAGLLTAGIMDHDSIGGGDEFRRAGEIAKIGTTCGLECRISLSGTPFAARKINSPDQPGIAYMAIHSVPHGKFGEVQKVFAPLRERRNERNRKMVAKINGIMAPYGIELDFNRDVLPISMFSAGGSVTERHIMCALGDKITGAVGKENVAGFLGEKLGIALSSRQRQWLNEADPLHFRYDVLGVLKSSFGTRSYIPADDELMDIDTLVKLADGVGAILCYAYLGDIADSPTGDKKAEKFEDEYLEELFAFLKQRGVRGITYMPSRNTKEQMTRLMSLCREHGMIEISGEDINQARQSFICKQLAEPMFSHLVGAAWKLVERERN